MLSLAAISSTPRLLRCRDQVVVAVSSTTSSAGQPVSRHLPDIGALLAQRFLCGTAGHDLIRPHYDTLLFNQDINCEKREGVGVKVRGNSTAVAQSHGYISPSVIHSGLYIMNHPPGVPVQTNVSLSSMDMADPSLTKAMLRHTNYFVCTLGQAALVNRANPPAQLTISAFIDKQAASIPDAPAVGFVLPPRAGAPNEDWSSRVLTFKDLQAGSSIVAEELSKTVLPLPYADRSADCSASYRSKTVALLCSSSPDFLFLWLAFTRLGFATLQIAPQCPPAAVSHLCETCDVSVLFYDAPYKDFAVQASTAYNSKSDGGPRKLAAVPTPFVALERSSLELIDGFSSALPNISAYWAVDEDDANFVQHTSGTSGMPKPILQSHRDSVGALPHLESGRKAATFTTTPLHHGGMVDMFRSWTSDALIWLFSGKDLPITAANVVKSLHTAQTTAENRSATSFPRVRYFASVPYVLQMLAADPEGLSLLRTMDIVGVGGAPLSTAMGNGLVENGVHLISRFGSTECGFLLSSHREYEKDAEWQYLRAEYGSEFLRFEPQGDGTSELVVAAGWPRIAKVNRADGSYATSDLFQPHPSIPHAWRYHSRADSQLALTTGKKFDPAPIESKLCALPIVAEAYVFGRDRHYPGAFLFLADAASSMSTESLVEAVWSEVEKINADSPPQARLLRKMIVRGCAENLPLEKSSKGTLLRGQVDERLQEQINKAYEDIDRSNAALNGAVLGEEVPDEQVRQNIVNAVQAAVGPPRAVDEDADLFLQGVDSVAAMQIRGSLQQLLPGRALALPLNIVYDCGTIKKLVEYVLTIRQGGEVEVLDETRQMLDLVEQYGDFRAERWDRTAGKEVVILTGATGALGAHILDLFRRDENVSRIHCLVRATDSVAARERVHKSLEQRGKSGLDASDDKIACVVARLGEARLGLPDALYEALLREATIIIHAAWAVNFSMKLSSFVEDHIRGLRNLLDLALASSRPTPPAFLFCSSVASVLSPGGRPVVPERPSSEPRTASPLGYAKSKWVGEAICQRAHQTTALHGRVHILRIGQLCGDTEAGIWNATEAWPLMLASVSVTGALPDLDEPLSWLPVDVAAKAVIQIARHGVSFPDPSSTELKDVPVYHILNPDTSTRWTHLLQWMRQLYPGSEDSEQRQRSPSSLAAGTTAASSASFEVVSPQEWITRLEDLNGEASKHPARKLLGLWKDAYLPDQSSPSPSPSSSANKDRNQSVSFEMTATRAVASVMQDEVQPVHRNQFEALWRWIEREMT